MNRDFWKSDTYKIVQAMRATGNQPGLIERWKESVETWAQFNRTDPDAKAILSWLPHWQVRPFYTVEELAPIFPALSYAFGYSARLNPPKAVRRLDLELDFAGLPYIIYHQKKFYIVERLHYWSRNARREEIEREFDVQR